MFKNYLKIAFRNILRYKGYTFINITGLAVGMTCCILMLLWVLDELGFDRFHENGENLYRVIGEIHTGEQTSYNARVPNAVGASLKEKYPEVVNFTRYQGFDNWLVQCGDKKFINDNLGTADPQFFEMFTFPFVKGDAKTALNDRHSIVLTENMAKKYFGDNDPMGKIIQIGGAREDFKVTGVIKNVPPDSHLQFDCIFPIVNMGDWWHEDLKSWDTFRFYTYIQLRENSSGDEVSQKITGIVKENNPKMNAGILLQPLAHVHLRSNYQMDKDNYRQGSITYVYFVTLLAFCILLIACINFMSLSTARSASRAKEVGMRKVIGARRRDLIKQFLGESVIFSFVSLLLALLLAEIFLPIFSNLSGKQLTLDLLGKPQAMAGLLAIVLFTGIVAGSYPALFLSSFQPLRVLKGLFNFKASRNAVFRKFLVIFQFALTIILIIGAATIYSQLNYIRNKDLGFSKEHVVYFFNHHVFEQNYEAKKSELLAHPNILNVTRSSPPLEAPMGRTGFDWEGKEDRNEVVLFPVGVDYDYIETFKMKMADGRFFSEAFSTDHYNYVLNEAAVIAMGLQSPVGRRMSYKGDDAWRFGFDGREGRIIGVVKDFHNGSLHNPIAPSVFKIVNEHSQISVRIRSENVSETLSFLEAKWKAFSGGRPFSYQFLDESIDHFYRAEQRIGTILNYSSFLAIFIACLGMFGLAAYTVERRAKEIGIRKVLGASVPRIVMMLSRTFTRWVLLAAVIAWPIGYLIMEKWLQNFAYRTAVGIGTFLFSALLALVIALVTVSYQSIRAAVANPVETLKYE